MNSLKVMAQMKRSSCQHVDGSRGEGARAATGAEERGHAEKRRVGWPPNHISILEHFQVGGLMCIVSSPAIAMAKGAPAETE